MNAMKLCQSCAMPMNQPEAKYGTEADGSMSEDYCHYCYKEGSFTANVTMDEMIEICVPHMVSDEPGGMSEETARSMMQGLLPALKRWQ